MRKFRLPDGLEIFCLNADEARFVHKEVFEERCYLQHGIELRDNDCVFDVGANIGLSTVFFHSERRGIRVCAFEPSPASFECLKANVELHQVNAGVFECGLSSATGIAEFTYYQGNTVRSGFHADLEADRATTKTYMLNSGFEPRMADLFLGSKFKATTFPCSLRTISEIIDQENVAKIDLLKVDVEKSEREVLAGIRAAHWPLIGQVVVEVDDKMGALDEVCSVLEKHGFVIATEQEPLLKGTQIFNIFASRR